MTIKKIITVPDPLLKEISEPISKVDSKIRSLLDDMLETMYEAPGIGLAAVQVGIPLRLIVMDVSWREEDGNKEPKFLINPKVVSKSQKMSSYEEGCLSIPEQYAEIERPESCIVEYLDYDGKQSTLKAEGILSTCVQHEIDHLNGILFIDYLSSLKRNMMIKKVTKSNKSKKDRVIV